MSIALPLPSAGVTTFDSLPDDCLLLIIQEAGKEDSTLRTSREPLVKKLSAVSKRLRSLCLPHIFSLGQLAIQIGKKRTEEQEKDIIDHLNALQNSSFAPTILQRVL